MHEFKLLHKQMAIFSFSAWSTSLSSSHESRDMFIKRANSKASFCGMSSLKSDVFLTVS